MITALDLLDFAPLDNTERAGMVRAELKLATRHIVDGPLGRVTCADGDEVSLGLTPRYRVYEQESCQGHGCFKRGNFA